jgi:large subunit ribosomal protein L15
MPLQRRLPKRGFTNIFKKVWIEINLAELDKRFDGSQEITPDLLAERGIIRSTSLSTSYGVVILGRGEVGRALNVTAHRFSTGAREKIEAAGGKTTLAETGQAAGKR